MSRWLAIWDPEQRLQPGEGRQAFSVYSWVPPTQPHVLHADASFWLGVAGSDPEAQTAATDPSGLLAVWDGSLYHQNAPELPEPAFLIREYTRHGSELLAALNGRWSFLLYDLTRRRIWVSRDRTGVKPLYYWTDGRRWAFASEPKLLLSLPYVERAFDPGAVFDYFVLNQVDAGKQTLFKGIRQLLPANEGWLDLEKGEWNEHAYYSLPWNTRVGRFDLAAAREYQSAVRETLAHAVKLRLQRLSGPPASLLSGGLDSSVLACLIHEQSREPLTALTASYHEDAFAEQEWAGQVARHLHARWLQTFPTLEALREDLEDFVYSQDTPTFSSGTYSQYCLFRLARENSVKTVFDGQGADALFGGHLPHLPALWRDLFLTGQWSSLTREWKAFGPLWKAWSYGLTHWMKYRALPGLPGGVQHLFRRWYFPELQYLNPELLEANRYRYAGGDWLPPRAEGPNTLNQALRTGYFGGPLSFLLKCVDRASSWAGVETCTPYSDDTALMELVFSIPGTYKIRGGVRKWMLREAFRDLLPEAVYQRQGKMALLTPNNPWMAGLRDLARAYLEEQDDALFNRKALLRDLDHFFNPNTSLENYRVYKYLSMIIWRSVFKV